MPCPLQERDRCPDRRRPEGDRVHVGRDGVEQHLREGRGAVLQVKEEARHHHADGAQVRPRLMQAARGRGVRGEGGVIIQTLFTWHWLKLLISIAIFQAILTYVGYTYILGHIFACESDGEDRPGGAGEGDDEGDFARLHHDGQQRDRRGAAR